MPSVTYDQFNYRETQLHCNDLKEDFAVNKVFELSQCLSTNLLPIDLLMHSWGESCHKVNRISEKERWKGSIDSSSTCPASTSVFLPAYFPVPGPIYF